MKENLKNLAWIAASLILAVGPLWQELGSWQEVLSFSGVVSTALVVAGVLRAWLTNTIQTNGAAGAGRKP
ncbi:MAG: hypothetical protein KJ058_13085 [Thermoanaerobaculia bacterium]|nr:hypothetical protein [Thermoanaerobaculia bacterium]